MPGTKKYLLLQLSCGILLSTVFSSSFAQPGEIVFTRATKENGLSATRIHSFIKDQQGYYWLSSVNGLQRFDGNRMVSFRHEANNSASLPDNDVGCMMEDNQKRLWVNAGGYPCIYNPLSRDFKKVPVDYGGRKDLHISSFFQDSKGMIWMLTAGGGLFVLDRIKNTFKPYTTVWPQFFSGAYNMTEDTETGRYWITTGKGDVVIYDSKNKEYYHNGNNPKLLQCFKNTDFSKHQTLIYLDKNRILWTHGWVSDKGFISFRYDSKKDELRFVNSPGPQFLGFLTDRSGTTWAYGTLLSRYDEKLNQFVEIPKKRNSLHGIDFNNIFNMYEDSEGNLWAMSDLGLYNFSPHRQCFNTTNNVWSSMANKSVDANTNGLMETRDGHIIAIGWSGDGLIFFDSAFKQIKPLYGFNPIDFKNDPNYLLAWCGLQDSKGIIWIGCQQGHILQINPYTKKIVTIHPPEFEDITIRSIAEDKDGNIWFGAQRSIIVKWERKTNTFRQILSYAKVKQPLDWILNIVRGSNGDLWIGTSSGGILHIDIATETIIEQFLYDENNPQSIGDNFTRSIVPLNKDTLVIATSKGIDLFRLSKKTFTHITENDGLPGGGIISLEADDRGNLWFTTVDGIAKIHLPEKKIHEYGPLDGVTEKDFQYRAVTKLKDGRIVFGNTRVLVYFNPASINETIVPSDAVISGIRIFDKSFSVDSLLQRDNKIRLKHSQNYITIQFASLGNIIYNRPVYYYMLEGINKDWVATQNPEANYSYLPAGIYTFKVKCISTEGIPSANTTSFTISIAPAFYQAWWFYAVIAIFIISIIFFIYRQQINKLLAVEQLRTKVARDLHDDMGSVLSTINILSTMAKAKVANDPVKTSEYIGKISDNSQRMMEAMDDIVWSIKPMNDSMQKITARMREFATGILEAKDIELDFKVEEKVNDIKLNMEARRDFFLIFKEAVNNMAKYSYCSKCSIHISLHKQRLLLSVHDNGIGFDVSKADGGNGLSNMQKRAESLKGRVSVQSKPGKGTQVMLNMPVQ
jgi:ligand-binding sensor domain-containing protein/two-component sensor histidine kinase